VPRKRQTGDDVEFRPPPDPDDDLETPEPTARPREYVDYDDERGDRLVPLSNVGGAAPTRLGNDSGGDFPGPEDDLSNLIEPEPPESPEIGAMHVRPGQGGPKPKPRR
jgi:hypothetical protein